MYLPEINTANAILQEITDPVISKKQLKLFIKREDLVHPYISGNKWYKLKYNLAEAADSGYDTVLSFGGAYSNHIYALAAAGLMFRFKTIGIIRGEEHLPLNPTLNFADSCGMQISYLRRSDYRRKTETDILDGLKQKFGKFYLIPEGGTNSLAVKGCGEIIDSIPIGFDYICTPCGTGGTIAGLISGAGRKGKVLGFPVLKGAGFLEQEINKLLAEVPKNERSDWKLIYDYHFGGYARYDPELLSFIEYFESAYDIPLDQVYTGKMMIGIFDLIRKNFFPPGSTIIALHTGGIQGRLDTLPYYSSSPSINPSSSL